MNKTEEVFNFLTKKRESGQSFPKCAVAHKEFLQENELDVSYVLFNRKYREVFPEAETKAKKANRVTFKVSTKKERGLKEKILSKKLAIDDSKMRIREKELAVRNAQDNAAKTDALISLVSSLKGYNNLLDDLTVLYETHIPEAAEAEVAADEYWKGKFGTQETSKIVLDSNTDEEPTLAEVLEVSEELSIDEE